MTWEPSRDDQVKGDHRPLPEELPDDRDLAIAWAAVRLAEGCTLTAEAIDELAEVARRAGISLSELAQALEILGDEGELE